MKLSPQVGPGAARIARGVGAFVARLRACVWAPLALRVVAVGAGLALLAVIGGSAFAGGGAAPPAASPAPAPLAPPPAPDPVAWLDAQAPLAAPAPLEPRPADRPAAHGRATPDDPVFLNGAGVDELRRLPGVGAKRAESIVQLRARMGRFRQVEDLLKVKGIGRAMLKKIRPLVRLDLASRDADAG